MTNDTNKQNEIERYVKITHTDKYGFNGYTSIKVAVTNETTDEIHGYKFRDSLTRGHHIGNEITVRKENVASWETYTPHPDMKTESEVKWEYVHGLIDEDELEEQLDDALLG